jgi:hypothetical protein
VEAIFLKTHLSKSAENIVGSVGGDEGIGDAVCWR